MNMKTLRGIFVITLYILLPLFAFAQGKPNFVGEWYRNNARGRTPNKVNDLLSRGPSDDFQRTKRYNLKANVNQLNSILRTSPALLDLVVPYGDKIYTLNLARVEITGPSYNVKTNNGNASHNKGVQYRGIVDGNPAHIASLSLTPRDIQGYFSTNEGNFVITKEGIDFIVYKQEDMPVPLGIYCLTPETTTEIPVTSNLITGIGCKTVSVYFECDYTFYQSKGSNLNTISDYVIGFFNQVASLYANENVAVQVSEMFVWTSPDPFINLTTSSDVLNSFRTTRGTNFNGNAAHFLTTRNLGGGIAYVDVLCNKAYAYGVSMVYSTYNNFPTYSWTVEVVTHELGHNLGSPHTHSCSWSTGPLDNCYSPEGSCTTGPAPVNGGTIMSYCHMTSYGINFNNGFGFYPGNRIRDRVLNATCIPGGGSVAPGGLNTSNITTSSATLNWSPASGAVNYIVQYKKAADINWISAGSTSSTSMNITGLTAGVNYVWTVRSDCSDFAANVSFTTGSAPTGCATPSGLTASGITETSATVSWSPVAGASFYSIQYKRSSDASWSSTTAGSNSANLTGLTAGTSYTWQVKADCSGYSAISSFTTSTPAGGGCTAPTGLSVTNITQTSATLNWSPVSGISYYAVQYKRTGDADWFSTVAGTNSANLTNLTANTSYTWQVKGDCSGFSVANTFTTSGTGTGGGTCPAPSGLNSSNLSQTGATLSWTPVTGATSYTVQYKTTAAASWASINSGSNSISVSGLTAGTAYVWQVKADCSPYSAQAGFTTLSAPPPPAGQCALATNLAESNINSGSATLGWTGTSNAQSFTVRFRESGKAWSVYTVSGNSITVKLKPRRSWEWMVDTHCSDGSSSGFTAVRMFRN
jgi:hypothetical protein